MASRGHRVIACAQKLLPGDKYDRDYEFSKNDGNYPSADYTFCGLISLEDPPKHGVREAIGTLRLAGIKVMMVTGDHPKTAEAIARKINLILGDTKETLSKKTGRPMEEIYEDEVDAVVVERGQHLEVVALVEGVPRAHEPKASPERGVPAGCRGVTKPGRRG